MEGQKAKEGFGFFYGCIMITTNSFIKQRSWYHHLIVMEVDWAKLAGSHEESLSPVVAEAKFYPKDKTGSEMPVT